MISREHISDPYHDRDVYESCEENAEINHPHWSCNKRWIYWMTEVTRTPG